MAKHTASSVLRASTAKVQPRYRGKPYRVRSVSSNRMSVVLMSNEHMVLAMTLGEAIAIYPRASHAMKWCGEDINYLASLVADYRNAQEAGRTTGRIAAHVKQAIKLSLDVPLPADDAALQAWEIKMRYAVVESHGYVLGHFPTVHESSEAYRKARNKAWEAGKADASVSCWQDGARAQTMKARLATKPGTVSEPEDRTIGGIADRNGGLPVPAETVSGKAGPIATAIVRRVAYSLDRYGGREGISRIAYKPNFHSAGRASLLKADHVRDCAVSLPLKAWRAERSGSHTTADLLLYAYRMLSAIRDGHLSGKEWLKDNTTMDTIHNRLVNEGKF